MPNLTPEALAAKVLMICDHADAHAANPGKWAVCVNCVIALLTAQAEAPVATGDDDLVRAYDVLALIAPYLRPDVTRQERQTMAQDMVRHLPLRRAERR